MSSFGEKIKKLRKERGWSQDAFAEQVGIHGRHVGKYEIGRALPNAETLIRIAKALDVSLDYLFLEEGDPNPASRIRDRELLHAFETVDQMQDEDKRTIKSLIDAYIKKQQMERVLASGAVAR